MLHCIYHPSGVAAGRPFLNFASQLLDLGGQALLLITEHPGETDLMVQSAWLVLPCLERAYPRMDWDRVEMVWASRDGQRDDEPLVVKTYNPDTGEFAHGWRNEGFSLPNLYDRFESDQGFTGRLWEIALIDEARLSSKEPYSR